MSTRRSTKQKRTGAAPLTLSAAKHELAEARRALGASFDQFALEPLRDTVARVVAERDAFMDQLQSAVAANHRLVASERAARDYCQRHSVYSDTPPVETVVADAERLRARMEELALEWSQRKGQDDETRLALQNAGLSNVDIGKGMPHCIALLLLRSGTRPAAADAALDAAVERGKNQVLSALVERLLACLEHRLEVR